MILVKSVLAGLAAVTIYQLVTGAIIRKWLSPSRLPPMDVEGGGFTWHSPGIPLWSIPAGAVMVFATVLYWTLKHAW